ncbi:MAG: putative OsmC-like protein [Candidatus Poriferisodalaceae bacterium]|jgi:uncharacterized OsmC-like protein
MTDQLAEPTPQTDQEILAGRIRIEGIVAQRPDVGTDPDISVTTLIEGVKCETVEGDWTTVSDLPAVLGGTGTACSPGALMRASLGTCLAMGYKIRACRLGVAVDSIKVTVTCQAALVGHLDLESGQRPGYDEIRYHIELRSEASEADLAQVTDEADELSPILDALGNLNNMRKTVEIHRSAASASATSARG